MYYNTHSTHSQNSHYSSDVLLVSDIQENTGEVKIMHSSKLYPKGEQKEESGLQNDLGGLTASAPSSQC